MKMSSYRWASGTLLLFAAILLASYPFRHSFWGGLLAGAGSAAVIGGLADWFAVTALFRRPLGIPPGIFIRTDIIIKNRERIFNDLAGMVETELLTVDILRNKVKAYCFPRLVFDYIEENNGLDKIKGILHQVMDDLLENVESDESKRVLSDLLSRGMSEFNLAPLLAGFLKTSTGKGYPDKILDFLLGEAEKLAQHQKIRMLLTNILSEALTAYERGLKRREILHLVLGLSPQILADSMQEKIVQILFEIKENANHPLRGKIRERLFHLAEILQDDIEAAGRIEEWKAKNLLNIASVWDPVAEVIVNSAVTTRIKEEISAGLVEFLDTQLENFYFNLKHDDVRLKALDQWIKSRLNDWIGKEHSQISRIVKESLNRLDNRDLVEIIESKAGTDLQMIRINGSIVGALTGVFLYLISYALI